MTAGGTCVTARGARWHAVLALSGAIAAVSGAGCRRSSHMPPKADGAAVVVAPEATGEAGLTMSDEVEPNDLLANAQPLNPTSVLSVAIAGRLVSPPGVKAKDVDLYRIVVPPPAVVVAEADGGGQGQPRQRLSVEVRPDVGLSVSVDALDDLGKLLVSAVGTTNGESEAIPNLAVIPGTYFVRVKPGGGTTAAATGAAGSAVAGTGGAAGNSRRGDSDAAASAHLGPAAYRLTVRLLPFEAGDEVEPNGKGTLANDVAPGADVAGFLAWRKDEDWFRLPLAGLPEGSVLSADLDSPPQVAATLAVYDSVEHKMIEQHGARRGDRVAIRNVRLPSSEPSVFVVVRADVGRNSEARYTLRLRTEEAKADAELEPNDDPPHAVPLVDGNYLGYLGPGDVDVYRYTAAMPTELDFEATPPDHVDLKLEVLREDGSVLLKVDAGKRREAERLPNIYVSGAVLLRLSSGKGDGNLDEPYRITASSHPITPGAEREPNGTVGLATPLPDGTTGNGLLYPRGDVDFWQTQTAASAGSAASGVSLAVAVRGVPGLALDVRVAGTGGKELAHFRVAGDASAPTRVTPGADGCCLVQIREATGRGANPRDRYSLSVAP